MKNIKQNFKKYLQPNLFLIASVFISMLAGIMVSPYVRPNNNSSLAQVGISNGGSSIVQTSNSNSDTIVQVTQKVLPSVVTIQATTTNSFFNWRGGVSNSTSEQNIGSGLILTADGFILTDKHVVSDSSSSYAVITNDNKTYPVKKISLDSKNDLAVIKIDASGLQPLALGDSTKLLLGQTVIAIGSPLGEFTNSVTTGVISGLGRNITASLQNGGQAEQLKNLIQTDAPINPGNSGGPLINLSGQVVGISVATASSGQNIGFAIPIADALDYIHSVT